jgi:ABC-type amino acid transport substrate-binding protein
MKPRLAATAGALAAALFLAVAPAWPQASDQAPRDEGSLAVCLQQNDPPLSARTGDSASGFDVALSRIIAQRLGRELRVQWFVSRDDPDSNLAKDSNALLSDGHCDLVADYPLTEDTLAVPRSPTVRLPPFKGAKPDDRRRWVKTGALAPTRPYRLDALTVVLSAHDADRPVRTLHDLQGMRVGVLIATLADAIAMQYGGGQLSENVVHLPDAPALFAKLQDGKLDAAFIDLRAFDAWRLRHDSAGLRLSDYRHSIGFNMGFVGLASNRALVEQVDGVLADLAAHDALAPLAHAAGLTFLAPRIFGVQPNVPPAAVQGD